MTTGPPLGIVYDLDDTLFPEIQYARSGLRAVGQALADELGAPDLVDRLLRCFDQGERKRVYDRVLEDLGRTDAQSLVPRMVELHRAHRPRIDLYPDAAESIRHWRTQARLGIISDGYLVAQNAKIAALGLETSVDEVILTDQRGPQYWKPHPWAFEQMAARLAVPHHRCAYVADNPEKDFIAPNALGWTSIWLHRPGGVYADRQSPADGTPDFTIADLAELPRLLTA